MPLEHTPPTHYRSLGYVPTRELPAYVRELIKGLRESRGAGAKPRGFRPREVRICLCDSSVTVDIEAWGVRAANGSVVHTGEHKTWIGSDGEPNYSKIITFAGPAVVARGYGRNVEIDVRIPVPMRGDQFYALCARAEQAINDADWTFFFPFVDHALENPDIANKVILYGQGEG